MKSKIPDNNLSFYLFFTWTTLNSKYKNSCANYKIFPQANQSRKMQAKAGSQKKERAVQA